MTRKELLELEQKLYTEHQRRKLLGGYNADTEGILLLCTATLMLVQHLLKKKPAKPVKTKTKRH